jgi:hypothetical protein
MVARMNSIQSLRMSIANFLIFSYNMSILNLTTYSDATACDCQPPFTSSQLHPCMTPHDWLLRRVSGAVARRIHMEVVVHSQSILRFPKSPLPSEFLAKSHAMSKYSYNGDLTLLQRTNLLNMQKPKEFIWNCASGYVTVDILKFPSPL